MSGTASTMTRAKANAPSSRDWGSRFKVRPPTPPLLLPPPPPPNIAAAAAADHRPADEPQRFAPPECGRRINMVRGGWLAFAEIKEREIYIFDESENVSIYNV